MDQLVGAAEIAGRLGVKYPSTVHGWHRRGIGFPDPVVVLSGGMVWAWPDVAAWAKATGRPTVDDAMAGMTSDPNRANEEGPGPEANDMLSLTTQGKPGTTRIPKGKT